MAETITKVYRYGLLPPTRHAERVDEQIRLAHRYYNTLVEIERRRREQVTQIMESHDRTQPIRERIAALERDLEAHRRSIQATKAATRKRSAVPAELRARTTALRDELRQARADLKAAKQALREDAAIGTAVAAVNAAAKAEQKAARAACGVYWGTYLLIEQAIDQARRAPVAPHRRRWTGDGAVGVQIQGGLSVGDVTAATDTRLQIDLAPQPVPGRSGQPRPRVRLRIGSSDTREPIWAEWPVIYHRPLPDDGRIKTASVVRRVVCGRAEWSLHLTVERPAPTTESVEAARVVAVDLGWRRTAGTLRAGAWADETGEHDILLDATVPSVLDKVESLQAIRDRELNALRAALVAWRHEHADRLPESHRQALERLPIWRSPARFAALALWWRAHRIDGDADIVDALEAWRKQDKHLWLWQTHARRKAIGRRREQYRRLAAALAARYDVLVIERINLAATRAIPQPEEDRDTPTVVRYQQHVSAPHELRTALVNAFRSRGRQVVTVPPSGPAATLLAAYRERRDVGEMPAGAREAKFARIRRERGLDAGAAATSTGV